MRWTMLILLVVLCTGMSGCAGMGGPLAGAKPVALASDDVDAEKVATVNQWAQTHGATVVWLNYPTRPHPRSDSGGGN